MKKKLLSLALALVMCLSLTVPALAADAPHDVDTRTVSATWKTWGDSLLNDSSLIINGVIGQEPFDDTVIFDVVAGGGFTLNMGYPSGRERFYNIYMDNAVLNRDKQIEEMKDGWSQDRMFENGSAQKQFVYTCPESMVSTSGNEMLFHYWLDWSDSTPASEYSEHDGNVSFWLRVHPASSAPASSTGFTDVAANSPFAKAIQWAVEKDITKGTSATTFGPNQTCTVSHILTFLWRANGKPGAAAGTSDRSSAAAWAVKQDLIDDPNDIDDPCFRGQAVYFMWKVAGSPKADPSKLAFTDMNTSLPYASAVAWAVEKGVTSGTSATAFSPDKTCTRGQIVTFLYRADSK